ncbi:MAG: hypothetical protein ACKO9A_00530 [Alphaproteobacteria bacterium]
MISGRMALPATSWLEFCRGAPQDTLRTPLLIKIFAQHCRQYKKLIKNCLMEVVLLVTGLATVTLTCIILFTRRKTARNAPNERTISPRVSTPLRQPSQGVAVIVQYAAASGEVINRHLEVRELKDVQYEGALRPRLLLLGWCQQRHERVEIPVTRIGCVADPRTGGVYDKKDTIISYLRLITPGNLATPEDRRAEGRLELERAEQDRKLILAPINVTIGWRFSHGKGDPQTIRVWVTAIALRADSRAYALFVETMGGISEERPYFITPLGSGHREVVTLEVEEAKYEQDAIAEWAEQWLRKPE